jgi:hypothetical protein
MQEYSETSENEHYLTVNIKELDRINKKLAKLLLRKEELTENIIGAFGHEHEGQRQYEYDVWKVEIKTPCIYSLNKKRYESGNVSIPDEFNPIKQSISYSIDKKLCDKYWEDAPVDIRSLLFKVIEKKPGKKSVKIFGRDK